VSLGLLAFFLLAPTVEATHILNVVMAADGDGVAYARASGGAECRVDAAAHWSKVYDDGMTRKYRWGVDFANYDYIIGKVWVVLDAPGWFDESYFDMDVYHDGAPMGHYETSSGGYWEGYMWSDEWIIGSSGEWKFVVVVEGLDYGSRTCWAKGEFTVYDI
jgi:hypothetical protein